MLIGITKITTLADAHLAIESTMHQGFEAKCSLDQLYRWEHSPSRTQLFWVNLIDVATCVSVHFVRHAAVGQLHFVKSNRDDRGGDPNASRLSPVNHRMMLNAQHLIDMSKLRLCHKAHALTREAMHKIKDNICIVDPDLSKYMVPKCVYQGGFCSQPKPCGNYRVRIYDPERIWESIRM